jgi:hypothetical protein
LLRLLLSEWTGLLKRLPEFTWPEQCSNREARKFVLVKTGVPARPRVRPFRRRGVPLLLAALGRSEATRRTLPPGKDTGNLTGACPGSHQLSRMPVPVPGAA